MRKRILTHELKLGGNVYKVYFINEKKPYYEILINGKHFIRCEDYAEVRKMMKFP